MKVLVLGHSDSDGSKLANPADGWPYVLQRRIAEESGIEIEIVHRLLFAGPTAVQYMERQLDEESPDIVVVGTSGYGVVVQLASNRIRERFGPRAANVAVAAEVRVAELSKRLGPRGKRTLTEVRRAGRKLIGTRPAFSFEALVECYEECLDRLAQREQMHTIVFGGLGYGRELQRLNPRLNELQDGLHERLRAAALKHHFDWVVHEEILGGREAKLAYMQKDGVHSNEEAQRMAAAVVTPLVMARL
jgi:lysophospholipase L1-like esterase